MSWYTLRPYRPLPFQPRYREMPDDGALRLALPDVCLEADQDADQDAAPSNLGVLATPEIALPGMVRDTHLEVFLAQVLLPGSAFPMQFDDPWPLNVPATRREKERQVAAVAFEKSIEPPKNAPAQPTADATWTPSTNAFGLEGSQKIPYADIIALFPTREKWLAAHKLGLETHVFNRKKAMAYLLYRQCIKNQFAKDVIKRGEYLARGFCALLPAGVLQNHAHWVNWIATFDEVVANVLKQIDSIDLLTKEYRASERLWYHFWDLHILSERYGVDLNAPNDPPLPDATSATARKDFLRACFARISIELATHNRRRVFLQKKVMKGCIWMQKLYVGPPVWVDWGDIIEN